MRWLPSMTGLRAASPTSLSLALIAYCPLAGSSGVRARDLLVSSCLCPAQQAAACLVPLGVLGGYLRAPVGMCCDAVVTVSPCPLCGVPCPCGSGLAYRLLPAPKDGGEHNVPVFDEVPEGQFRDATGFQPVYRGDAIADKIYGRAVEVQKVIELAPSELLSSCCRGVIDDKIWMCRLLVCLVSCGCSSER